MAHALAIYNHRHQAAPRAVLGQTWWINFRERHHHRLTSRTPDIIDRGRASCAKRGPIEEYFRLLTTTLEEHGLREKPCQSTRLDRMSPPFIIYKGGYPGGPYNKEGVPDALYGKSPAGYIDSELFRKWFVGHFLKFAIKERPLLLVMDGHESHLDPELVRAAQREGVILFCLPIHTSHILKPLDVSFFRALKADVSGVTGDLSAVSQSFLVSKKEYSRVLRDSFQRVENRRLVVAGFRRCGLYPLDPMTIDCSRVMPSGLRRVTSSPPPPTPSASSWAASDAALPSQHPLPPRLLNPPPIPHPQNQHPPTSPRPPTPPPPNPYITHPLVTSGWISIDLAHLLAKINYNHKVRRNITNARVLTAHRRSLSPLCPLLCLPRSLAACQHIIAPEPAC